MNWFVHFLPSSQHEMKMLKFFVSVKFMESTCLHGSPSGGPGVFAEEVVALLRQANGRNVGLVGDVAVQPEDGDVVAIGLRSEFEVRVDVNLGDANLDRRQRLDVRIERILAQRDLDLFRFRPAVRPA